MPPELGTSLQQAVRGASLRSSACVPDGTVLLSMVNEEQAPLRHLQFSRVRHETCLMDRVVSVCWNYTDALGTCVIASPVQHVTNDFWMTKWLVMFNALQPRSVSQVHR